MLHSTMRSFKKWDVKILRFPILYFGRRVWDALNLLFTIKSNKTLWAFEQDKVPTGRGKLGFSLYFLLLSEGLFVMGFCLYFFSPPLNNCVSLLGPASGFGQAVIGIRAQGCFSGLSPAQVSCHMTWTGMDFRCYVPINRRYRIGSSIIHCHSVRDCYSLLAISL